MKFEIPEQCYDDFCATLYCVYNREDGMPYRVVVDDQWASEADLKRFIKELQRMIKIRNTGELK